MQLWMLDGSKKVRLLSGRPYAKNNVLTTYQYEFFTRKLARNESIRFCIDRCENLGILAYLLAYF